MTKNIGRSQDEGTDPSDSYTYLPPDPTTWLESRGTPFEPIVSEGFDPNNYFNKGDGPKWVKWIVGAGAATFEIYDMNQNKIKRLKEFELQIKKDNIPEIYFQFYPTPAKQ